MAWNLLRHLQKVPISELPVGETCSICWRPYGTASSGETVEFAVRLECKHVFGSECIYEWLAPEKAGRNTCPACRRRHILFLPDDEEGYIEQYGDEEFSEYIKSLEDSEPEKARFLERYRQCSHPEDTFDPEGGDNEDKELEQSRDRRDWNKEWQSIFESLGAIGDCC